MMNRLEGLRLRLSGIVARAQRALTWENLCATARNWARFLLNPRLLLCLLTGELLTVVVHNRH